MARVISSRRVEWVEHDGVKEPALPEWARDAGEELPQGLGRALKNGLVVRDGKDRWLVLRWEQVLAIARSEDRAYVLVPRRPPSPPWFEVSLAAADKLEQMNDARREQAAGLRGAPLPPRVRLPPDEVLARVLARHDVPGAVEVPLRASRFPWVTMNLVGVWAGGLSGFYSLVFLDDILRQAVLYRAAGTIGTAVGVGVVGCAYARHRIAKSRAKRPRMLVMTPDAYVGALDGRGVRAIPWDEIREFRAIDVPGPSRYFGRTKPEPALEVVGLSGEVLARVPARSFDIGIDVMVALAAAYRERAMME